MAVTQVTGSRRQRRLHREHQKQIFCLSRSTGVMIMVLFMIGCCSPATTTTTAFQIASSSSFYSPASSLQTAFRPIVTKQQLPCQRHGWYKSILSSNNNQWEDDIIISPDLSKYFSKKQTSSSSSSSSPTTIATDNVNLVVATKSSDALSTTKVPIPESSTNTAVSSSSSSSQLSADISDENDLDDNMYVDDSSIVQEIVSSLQSTIENGSKNKNMIPDIMILIQRLQRIQQQWYIRNNDNSNENDDNEKIILMKNPKKRSSNTAANTKKKKGGLAKTTSVTTTSVVTSQQQQRSSSSSSNSMILQRFLQSRMNVDDDEISYRLLWVGSDDAISAFGTGLHKVPLARLQEVFISISIPLTKKKSNASNVNRFRLTTTEVIRILGPFPNIKNTLQGICTISSAPHYNDQKGEEQWNITWDSMIDGTGKELIGRNNDDVRQVPTIQMLYGDEQIIVASIQKEGIATQMDTSSNNVDALPSHQSPIPAVGSILLFVREMEMDDKLTALRVL